MAHAMQHMGKAALARAPIGTLLEQLREQHGVDLNTDVPQRDLRGVFLKKEAFQLPGRDPRTGAEVRAQRTRISAAVFDWSTVAPRDSAADRAVQLAAGRVWPQWLVTECGVDLMPVQYLREGLLL